MEGGLRTVYVLLIADSVNLIERGLIIVIGKLPNSQDSCCLKVPQDCDLFTLWWCFRTVAQENLLTFHFLLPTETNSLFPVGEKFCIF